MKVILYIVAGLSVLGWLFTMANARSAIHEIYGAVLFLCAVVALAGGAIVSSIKTAAAERRADTAPPVDPKTHVLCPDCREAVKMDAKKCRYCGTSLVPQ